MRAVCFFFLACAMVSESADAQQGSSADAHVAGIVVDAQTDIPLRRARVTVTVESSRVAPVFTDELGNTRGSRLAARGSMDTPFDSGMTAHEVDGIDVVVSANAAVISGRATRPGGEAAADYIVLLFSTDSLKWYRNSQALKVERSSQKGEFRIGSLPPGSYDLIALSDTSDLITSNSWQDPATLERLRPLATPVTVHEGEAHAVVLQLAADR